MTLITFQYGHCFKLWKSESEEELLSCCLFMGQYVGCGLKFLVNESQDDPNKLPLMWVFKHLCIYCKKKIIQALKP